ncbi:MAG: hypothetical protein JO001_29180 [Alphaproteobacteria bacterium]|nr:hypothetical protein [Alphaproteobacteria bacterium]
MPEAVERQGAGDRPVPKLGLGLAYCCSMAAGLLPYWLLIHSPSFFLFGLCLEVVFFTIGTWTRKRYAGDPPIWNEIALAILGRVAAGGVIAMFGIILYAVVAAIRSWFAPPVSAGLDPWVLYISLGLVAFLILVMSGVDGRDVAAALYPERAGQRSSWFAAATEGRARLVLSRRFGTGLALLLAVLLMPLIPALLPLYAFALFVLSIAFVIIGADWLDAKTVDALQQSPHAAVEAAKALLEAAGYQVRTHPRTGDIEVDSVASVLDFLALRQDRALAGRVVVVTPGEIGDPRQEAALLEPAVWVLEDNLSENDVKLSIEPVLLMIGGETALSMTWSSGGKAVRIIAMPTLDALTAMIGSNDAGPLKQTAERLFGAPPPQQSSPPSLAVQHS